MSFAEVRFPTDIAYGSTGGPGYATEIVATRNGYEQRNSQWATARLRYNVAHGVKTGAQLATLIAFFRARKGRAEGFRFKDWTDYQAVNQSLGVGDGSRTQFSLVKTYQSGDSSEVRLLKKPVEGSVNLYLDSVVQPSGYTLDSTTGVVTFGSAPANGVVVSADCEFDVPVRFDTDQLIATLDAYGSHSWQEIPLVEIRL